MGATFVFERLPFLSSDTGILSQLRDFVMSRWQFTLQNSPGSTIFGVFDSTVNAVLSYYKFCNRSMHTYLPSWGAPLLLAIVCGSVSVSLYVHSGRRRTLRRNRNARRRGNTLNGNADVQKNLRQETHGGTESKSSNNRNDDPGILKKHSTFLSYTTETAVYPSIRTFFYPHPHADKFPSDPTTLPLLVFVHGLGGSLAQFHPLLTTLTNIASCAGIDFPGCGLSSFSPRTWSAYSVESLSLLLAAAIERHRDASKHQKVILVGHSLGTAICSLLSSSISPVATGLRKHIVGFIAVCPVAEPPSRPNVANMRRLLRIPGPIFDLWRRWDRRGGLNSLSVSRFVGARANSETRARQLRFNEQSKTPVWRRMAWGTLPTYNENGDAVGGIPGRKCWGGISDIPLLLIAGESDSITKATNVATLLQFLGVDPDVASWSHVDGATPRFTASNQKSIAKSFTFPAPASHALLYDTSTYRTLSGLIQDFVAKYVDERLSLGWQLQYLTTSGKWDVKNLAKWQAVNPVSDPIGGIFVAMKTLREVDVQQSPLAFAAAWRNKIYAVVDISHDRPVYDPMQLEKGGIHYHKLPTVSKIPPTTDEVRDFISLVDRLREEVSQETATNGTADTPLLLGVHCHYGFNRTGFFVTSYLIQRLGFTVQGALDEFEKRRPPGIRHEHFIDTLFVRYCVGNS